MDNSAQTAAQEQQVEMYGICKCSYDCIGRYYNLLSRATEKSLELRKIFNCGDNYLIPHRLLLQAGLLLAKPPKLVLFSLVCIAEA